MYYLLCGSFYFFAVFLIPIEAMGQALSYSKTSTCNASHCLSSLHQLSGVNIFTSNNRLVFYAFCPTSSVQYML